MKTFVEKLHTFYISFILSDQLFPLCHSKPATYQRQPIYLLTVQGRRIFMLLKRVPRASIRTFGNTYIKVGQLEIGDL